MVVTTLRGTPAAFSKDIAKRLDISQAAVSRAIGQLKDKGIRHRLVVCPHNSR
jgi:Mn-dependent DtxR family transcriptional regulator